MFKKSSPCLQTILFPKDEWTIGCHPLRRLLMLDVEKEEALYLGIPHARKQQARHSA